MRTRMPHLPHLIRTAAPTAELVPDRALLAEFVTAKCGMAFELLVRRHGPAVWAVCRRHLANTHDAEDAFQATFLVLAKSAKRVANTASVGGWLYGVAYRVALKARRTTARRKRIEAVVSPTDEPVTLPVSACHDTAAVVHAELEKLPDRYRLPLLLCDLEGLSRKEAAGQLGWSEGTLSGRLNRARKLLAGRLTTRGIAAAVAIATTLPPSQALTVAAVGVGLNVFDTSTIAVPEAVTALAHGAMRDMTRSFVLKAAGVVLAASVLLGGGLFGLRFDTAPQATAAPVPKVEMAKADDITDALVELVSQPAVQRELKLSADQRVSLIDGFDKLAEELEKGGMPSNPPSSGGQAGGGAPAVPSPWVTHAKARRELVASAMTKGQLTRLQQSEVQALGTRALLLKRVQDELRMTDDQKKAMTKALREVDDALANTIPAVQLGGGQGGFGQQQLVVPNGPLPALDQVAPAEHWKALDEVVKGFSAGQEKRWKELNGEKVGFNRLRVRDQCSTLFTQLHANSAATGTPDAGPQPTTPVAGPGIGAPDLPLPLLPPAQPLPPPGNPGK